MHNPEEDIKKVDQGLAKSREWGDKIPIGVFYQNEFAPTFEDRISQRIPDYREKPPARQMISTSEGSSAVDLGKMLEDLRVT